MSSKFLSTIRIKLPNFIAALIVAVSSCGASLLSSPAFAKSTSCDDVRLIFARGSGEALNGPSMVAWRDEITAAIGKDPGFTYSFYELGSQPQGGYQYPAVPVSDSFDGYVNLVGAYFGSGELFRFGASVEEGIKELQAYVASVSASCPQTKFVFGGYSQGAMILSGSLSQFNPKKIVYVSTFGDPKIYLPEGNPTFLGLIPKVPDACRGLNLSPYRISVSDCRAYEGVLGSYRPYQPENFAGKLGTWCNGSDIMCSSGSSFSDHTAYTSSNLYRDAARVIARKLTLAFANHNALPGMFRTAKHEVAFVIDTSISMYEVIDQYKDEAKALATQVKADGGEVALYEYRDLWDNFQPRQLCDFSCSVDDFSRLTDGLEIGGGSDIPESALSAIYSAMNNLDWQTGATKSIVLLTDAFYRNPDYDGTTLKKVIQRSLEIDPVNVFVVVPDKNGNVSLYQSLAKSTSGQVFALGKTDPTTITDAILNRPIARLALSQYSGQAGDEFYFDASGSYATDGGNLRFDWDLDGDGQFEFVNQGSTISYTYNQASNHFIQVRVTDEAGRFSTMSARVSVSDQPTTFVTVSSLEATAQPDAAISVSFRTDGAKALLTVDDTILGFLEVKDGAGQFTLQDAPEKLTITVIPYSATDQRGISRSLSLPVTGNPDHNTNEPSNAASITPPCPTAQTSVPKAPNTGLINRRYR